MRGVPCVPVNRGRYESRVAMQEAQSGGRTGERGKEAIERGIKGMRRHVEASSVRE